MNELWRTCPRQRDGTREAEEQELPPWVHGPCHPPISSVNRQHLMHEKCKKIKFELALRTHTDYCGHWLVRTCNAWLHTLMHEYKMRCTTQAVFSKSTWESPASQLVSCRALASVNIPYPRPLLNPWRTATWGSPSWRFSCRRPMRRATLATFKRRGASPGRYLGLSNNSFGCWGTQGLTLLKGLTVVDRSLGIAFTNLLLYVNSNRRTLQQQQPNTITGTNNSVRSGSGIIVSGNGNTVVSGENNNVSGSNNTVTSGSSNVIVDSNHVVTGSNNTVSGNNNRVTGNNNVVSGSNQVVSGDNKVVTGG